MKATIRNTESGIRRPGARLVILLSSLSCLLIPVSWGYPFAGGTGEPNDPYQIATAQQVIDVGQDRKLHSRHFMLVADIDLDPNLPGGRVFDDALIAPDESNDVSSHSGHPFSGTFDGRGHVIRNLWISARSGHTAGLFGFFGSDGLVQDLHLKDVHVSGSICGALAGFNHEGTILHCSVTGQVSGSDRVGGLVGDNTGGLFIGCESQAQVRGEDEVGALVGHCSEGTFLRCEAQADVNGVSCVGGLVGSMNGLMIESRARGTVVGVNCVGGLIGRASSGLTILRCVVDCNTVAQEMAGGLIGEATGVYSMLIVDSYIQGSVTGSVAGGLIGGDNVHDESLMNCYAACQMIPGSSQTASRAIGGIFGFQRWGIPLMIGCLWDTELSGLDVSTGGGGPAYGIGLPTGPMQTAETFLDLGWDFAGTWTICEGKDYPRLLWEQQNCSD